MSRSKTQVGISRHEALVILDLAAKHIAKNVSLNDKEQVRQLSVNNGSFKDLIATGTGFYLRLDRQIPFNNEQAIQLAQQTDWIQQRHQAINRYPHSTIPLQIRVMDFTEPGHWDCLSTDPIIDAIRVLYESEGAKHKPTARGYKKYIRQIIWNGLYAVEAIEGEPLSDLYAAERTDGIVQTRSLHSMHDFKRDLYAMTQGLAHLHSLGFSHGDFTPNNILKTSQGQLYLIDPDDTKPLDYRGPRLWDNFSRFSPPEILFSRRRDTPGLLTDINGCLKGYPQAIDTYQLAMTAYFMVTGHANIFKLPTEDWQSSFWQDKLCKRLSRFTTIRLLDEWGYMDFSHIYFSTPAGQLLKQWIMQAMTFDPSERLNYSPQQLLQHDFFIGDVAEIEVIKKFTSVNRDIAAIVGVDSNTVPREEKLAPLEEQAEVQRLAGQRGRLTRAAAILYRGARQHGHSKVMARSRAYPSYRCAFKSLSTKQKVVAATAIVMAVAAIVAVNVVTVGIPILVATCVVGAAVIVGGVGVPLMKVRKQVGQANKSLRTAHRGVYVKFIDNKLQLKKLSREQQDDRLGIPRCKLLRLGRPKPVAGIFAVSQDSSDCDSDGVTQPLLKRHSCPDITARFMTRRDRRSFDDVDSVEIPVGDGDEGLEHKAEESILIKS
ncbi:MAG: serine/threonine-protein kinase [Coxiellaceae bacterium]|nr:serine/threonine-protein kinase [Coxiellaceae bacterium]